MLQMPLPSFFAADEDEGVEDDDSMYEGGGDEQDGWDSRGGSPVDEGDQDTDRQWHGSTPGCGKADPHPDL